MGAECDHHFSLKTLPEATMRSNDWRIVIGRVTAMKLKKFRIMVLPHWYEPRNDNDDPTTTDLKKFTFDSPEMQSLYKVLDLAQAQHMDICLVLWGCPVRVSLLDLRYKNVSSCFMADRDKNGVWITGPNNYQEWAENFSALIRHLVIDRNYSCVREITPVNEPDGGPVLAAPEYIKMVKILDARFRRDGIRDRVRFDLSDNTDTRSAFLAVCSDSLSREGDVFNSHTYIFGYDTPNEKILG
jgi:alpha-galactosidase